jgi:hypothetical protein
MSAIVLLIIRLVLVILLYGFLGWVLFTLWKDMQRQSSALDEIKIPQLGLYPQTPTNIAPVSFALAEVTVGREPTCDFVLDDRTISSKHARLVFRQNQWWLEDLGSTNGTFLNDQRIEGPTVITHGDRIQLGQYEFLITVDLLNTPLTKSSSIPKRI